MDSLGKSQNCCQYQQYTRFTSLFHSSHVHLSKKPNISGPWVTTIYRPFPLYLHIVHIQTQTHTHTHKHTHTQIHKHTNTHSHTHKHTIIISTLSTTLLNMGLHTVKYRHVILDNILQITIKL